MMLKNVALWNGGTKDFKIEGSAIIDGSHLTAFPGLIDPHVHFRTPGVTHKEDWISGAKAAIAGGITTVFDMPNTNPVTTTYERLIDKKNLIDTQLKEAGIPLHYRLFFGADRNHFDELARIQPLFEKGLVCGVKVFMGSSTGDLLMDDEPSLDRLFKFCAELDLLIAVHAENEAMILERTAQSKCDTFNCHSQIRSPEVACKALKQAIALTRKYGTRLYALHIGSRQELELLQAAKQEGLPIFIEIAPHYLFLDTTRYKDLQGKAQMNPPLREPADREFLWQAIQMGWIDTIGSDHAPHSLHDKEEPYCKCPSGVPGVQTTFSMLLNGYQEGRISLERIVELMCINPKRIFNLPDQPDYVLVDLKLTKTISKDMLYSKAGWSPYEGEKWQGWPVYTIINDQTYKVNALWHIPQHKNYVKSCKINKLT